MRRSLAIAMLLALTGCGGGMESAECVTADWRAIGYEDGAEGRGANHFAKRRKDCAGHGVKPDFEAYMAGRDRGLSQYCRPRNGYRLGERGLRYRDLGVCPSELEAAFLAGHADGYGLYERRAAVSRILSRLRRSKRRAGEIDFELVERTARLVAPDADMARRAALGIEIKRLADEKAALDEAIPRLEADHAAAEQDYDAHRKRMAARRDR